MMTQYAKLPPWAWAAIRRTGRWAAGAGTGHSFFADRSFWLAAPADLYRLQRVRVVWDALRNCVSLHPQLFAHSDRPA